MCILVCEIVNVVVSIKKSTKAPETCFSAVTLQPQVERS